MSHPEMIRAEDDPGQPGSPHGVLRGAVCTLVFLGTYVLGASGFATLVPWPMDYGQRAKFEYFAERKDEFDAIFIGSSVTAYGIVPEVFDAEMQARGHDFRSFNFGVGV